MQKPVYLSYLVFMAFLFFVFPSHSFAYEDGIFDHVPYQITYSGKVTGAPNLFDNNLSTKTIMTDPATITITIELDEPVDINRLFYAGNTKNSYLYFSFLDSAGVGIKTVYSYSIPADGYLNVDIKGVKSIRIVKVTSQSTYELYEFDAYGTYHIPQPPEDVKNLKAEVKHDRVNLSWQLPDSLNFHHVNIYRKTVNQPISFFVKTAYAAEGYDPLFETNGTYFNDLTVQPETTYEYLVTTESDEGNESSGVTVQVTTLPVPPPNLGGIEVIKDENGDITVKWTPQPGQMIIEIDGKEYTRVDAMLGQYTIPAKDIPLDMWGNPARIRLIPVAPNGDTGTPIVINPGGGWLVSLPFGVLELLQASVDLLMVLGPIILLVLVLWYVRPIMNLLKKAAKTGRVRT